LLPCLTPSPSPIEEANSNKTARKAIGIIVHIAKAKGRKKASKEESLYTTPLHLSTRCLLTEQASIAPFSSFIIIIRHRPHPLHSRQEQQ